MPGMNIAYRLLSFAFVERAQSDPFQIRLEAPENNSCDISTTSTPSLGPNSLPRHNKISCSNASWNMAVYCCCARASDHYLSLVLEPKAI